MYFVGISGQIEQLLAPAIAVVDAEVLPVTLPDHHRRTVVDFPEFAVGGELFHNLLEISAYEGLRKSQQITRAVF